MLKPVPPPCCIFDLSYSHTQGWIDDQPIEGFRSKFDADLQFWWQHSIPNFVHLARWIPFTFTQNKRQKFDSPLTGFVQNMIQHVEHVGIKTKYHISFI
ncbi:hypothetical protein AVEN_262973-1 [Araneus ventricosus]|uniref:Uncharacterized protein n=1 Tax=Araneus ventricosus TaxID=182803 RepID=A0A4Y2N1T6_ARAVE|nr:hypothetical protein AVEN_262973-1 [Araneus ventricosus]